MTSTKHDKISVTLKLNDEHARKEDEIYADLAARCREIARQVRETAALMEAQRELPMGQHDEAAWAPNTSQPLPNL